jgi:hypothetical protein
MTKMYCSIFTSLVAVFIFSINPHCVDSFVDGTCSARIHNQTGNTLYVYGYHASNGVDICGSRFLIGELQGGEQITYSYDCNANIGVLGYTNGQCLNNYLKFQASLNSRTNGAYIQSGP